MKTNKKIFACLSCGVDTGCANKLICDKCRVPKRVIRAKGKSKKALVPSK
jgi:hypothetical protein